MYDFISKSILASVSLGLLISCGGRSPDEVIKDVKGKTTSQISRDNDFANQMQGQWSTECKSVINPEFNLHLLSVPPTFSTKFDFRFDGNSFEHRQVFFSDLNCENQAGTITQKGDLERASDAASDRWAQQINLNYKSADAVPSSPEGVEWFNLVNLCGQQPWTINEGKNITTDSDTLNCPVEKVERTAYELVVIEDSKLYLGNNAKIVDSANRPAEVNRETVYNKN